MAAAAATASTLAMALAPAAQAAQEVAMVAEVRTEGRTLDLSSSNHNFAQPIGFDLLLVALRGTSRVDDYVVALRPGARLRIASGRMLILD